MTPSRTVVFAFTVALAAACNRSAPSSPAVTSAPAHADRPHAAAQPAPSAPPAEPSAPEPSGDGATQPAGPPPAGLAVATFAGGCFWCMEDAFEHVPGVRDAISGYTGGRERSPSYEDVSNHRTSHAEAIRVLYDPSAVTYRQLLDVYWRRIDPTAVDRAFVDVGHQYRSVIFVHSPEQRAEAERSRQELAASGRFDRPIVTAVEDAPVFWVAEAYHQNFWRTTPGRYHDYHEHSGRREFLRQHWGPDAPY